MQTARCASPNRLHVPALPRVKPIVSRLRLLFGLLAVSAFAADAKLDALLKTVESRYNKAKTLQVLFKEEYTPPGKGRRTDSGILMLSKPRKMRWVYSQPPGKLFVSDGKLLWLYTPDENRVERMKFQETDDLRAPLAFLLGKASWARRSSLSLNFISSTRFSRRPTISAPRSPSCSVS